MNLWELGDKVKQKFNQYSQIASDQIGKKVAEKYPVYKEKLQGMGQDVRSSIGEWQNKKYNEQGIYGFKASLDKDLSQFGLAKGVDWRGLQNYLNERNAPGQVLTGQFADWQEKDPVRQVTQKMERGEAISSQERGLLSNESLMMVAGVAESVKAGKAGVSVADNLATEAQKYGSAEEFVPPKNVFQDILPSKSRPNSVKEIVKSGGNPLYHDTSYRGVIGILDSGEIQVNQAPFGQISGQGPRVSTTRNFDNYSRYNRSPYRFVIDESLVGQKSIPANRTEFESIFNKPVPLRSVKSLSLDITNPALLDEMNKGSLREVISKANEKGIKIELFEGKILPDDGSNVEIQSLTKNKFIREFSDIYNKAKGTADDFMSQFIKK